jgi:hypothetical protein
MLRDVLARTRKATRATLIAALILAAAVLTIFVVRESSAFKECKAGSSQEESSQQAEKSFSYVFRSFVPAPLLIRCTGYFVKHNESAITAVSTVIIAIFTIILGVFTVSLARSTRIAANAADLSARAAIGVKLPIIRIKPDSLSHEDGRRDGQDYEEVTVHHVILLNLGATKAFPTEILYGWTVGDQLPKEPSYRTSETFLPNFILEPDPQVTPKKRLTLGMPLEKGQWAKICGGNQLWFYCTLLYDDFMEEKHSHGFCWCWANTGVGLGWRIETAAAYNQKT